jgi:hypothetical protein
MPYIPQQFRDQLDPLIEACPKGWASCYHLVKTVIQPARYHQFAQCIAVFECAVIEYARRTQFYGGLTTILTSLPCGVVDEVKVLADYISIHYPQPDGVLNYCCTLLVEDPTDLFAAKEYMYANDVGPYEDKAIAKNGDLAIYR